MQTLTIKEHVLINLLFNRLATLSDGTVNEYMNLARKIRGTDFCANGLPAPFYVAAIQNVLVKADVHTDKSFMAALETPGQSLLRRLGL